MIFTNSFVNCGCIEIYIIINKIIVFEVCKQLQIESYSLSKLKSLWYYDEQLTKKSIIYCLLFFLNVHDYKKDFYSIFIVKIKRYNFIFEKLWINKYKVVFDMFKNKILFLFKRCDYNDNKILTSKNLSFFVDYFIYYYYTAF